MIANFRWHAGLKDGPIAHLDNYWDDQFGRFGRRFPAAHAPTGQQQQNLSSSNISASTTAEWWAHNNRYPVIERRASRILPRCRNLEVQSMRL